MGVWAGAIKFVPVLHCCDIDYHHWRSGILGLAQRANFAGDTRGIPPATSGGYRKCATCGSARNHGEVGTDDSAQAKERGAASRSERLLSDDGQERKFSNPS